MDHIFDERRQMYEKQQPPITRTVTNTDIISFLSRGLDRQHYLYQ